jgi:hypothetical protein
MHQTRHTGAAAGFGHGTRQGDMGAVEVGAPGAPGTRMQDADQIDHGIGALGQTAQHGGIIHIRLDHLDRGQQDQVLRPVAPTGRHDHAHIVRSQQVGDVAADETGATDQ